MREILDVAAGIANNILFGITVIVFTTYLILMVYSAISLKRYLRKNSYVDYNSIITSPLVPSISVIVPAFNESANIIDNIRTLLSLYYSKFEIVVVNDGSTDDTLEKIIEAFELEKVSYYFDYQLPCQRVRGVYKSSNRSFNKLMVVDKVNGGKADALNTGLNVVRNDLIVSIDADSIMEQDTLMKLVKPFIEDKEKITIGAGGVIRIANSCEITGGKITKVHLPKKWLPRFQVMEYTRAFLIGRIAWSELDGLLVISGALGMFKRDVVIKAGGYSTKTVGEDMELVVRIRKYMAEQGVPYKVEYIPDPLCWTEVPSTLKALARQRSRWTRGTIETLYTHRNLFLNRKYGKLGMLGFPYWLFFEWLAPIIEFIGILIFGTLAILGKLNVSFFLLLLGFVYFFAVSLSIWSVLFEEITFHKYEKRRDVMRLVLTAFLEPLMYHPVALLMIIKGNVDKLFKKSTWGIQEREGFNHISSEVKPSEHTREEIRIRRIAWGVGGGVIVSLALVWAIFIGKPWKAGEDRTPVQTTREVTSGNMVNQTESAIPYPEDSTGPGIAEAEESVLEDTSVSHAVPEITQVKYHIIVGSYQSRENADRMLGNLKKLGFEPEILLSNEQYARVSLYSFPTRQMAIDSLKQIHNEPGMERAWIWKK